jgi:hypothetical protein
MSIGFQGITDLSKSEESLAGNFDRYRRDWKANARIDSMWSVEARGHLLSCSLPSDAWRSRAAISSFWSFNRSSGVMTGFSRGGGRTSTGR